MRDGLWVHVGEMCLEKNTKLPSVCKGTKAISVSLNGHLGQCQKFEGTKAIVSEVK